MRLALLLVYAAVGIAALRRAGSSRLAIAIAAAGLVFAAGYGTVWAIGDLDCRDAGTCSAFTKAARPFLLLALLALPLLLVVAAARGGLRRAVPRLPSPGGHRDRGWIVAGVCMLALAPLVVIGSDDRLVAIVLMTTVAAMALAPPLAARLTAESGAAVEEGVLEVGGQPRRGLLFRFSRGRQAGLGVTCLGFAVLGALLALDLLHLEEGDAGAPVAIRVVGGCCVLLGLIFGRLNLLEARHGQIVGLLDDGLAQRTWAGPVFIPWDAVGRAWEYDVRGAEFIGLSFDKPDRVQIPRVLRTLESLGSPAAEHSLPLVALRADPDRLFDEIARRVPA